MSNANQTFFTAVGCMDGRVQQVIADYGKKKFGADFPDTITEAGMDKLLPTMSIYKPDENTEALKAKLLISLDKHGSRGIVIHGHEDCAGNPVNDKKHFSDIKKSVKFVKQLIRKKKFPVRGVYVAFTPVPQVIEVI